MSHEQRAHAKLSPSGACRWIECPASPQIEELFPDVSSEASKEGTLAHELAEIEVLHRFDMITPLKYNQRLSEIRESEYYNQDMVNHISDFVEYIDSIRSVGIVNGLVVELLVETRLDLGAFIPESFGTGDVVLRVGDILHVIDLKYGFLYVSPVDNPQLKIYGVGALELFDWDLTIFDVNLHIFQPRCNNVSDWVISVNDLADWAETDLKTFARRAFNKGGEQKAGEHCRFCKANSYCEVLKHEATGELDKLVKTKNMNFKLLSQDERIEAFLKLPIYKLWSEALSRNMELSSLSGEKFKGLKVVEGKSKREIADEKKVVQRLIDEGYDEELIYTKKLIPLGEIEKLFGKDITSGLTVKPRGKKVLVAESDFRSVYQEDEDINEIFKD